MTVYWIGTEMLPSKDLLQGCSTWKDRGTIFTRGIGFEVPILTGRGFVLVQPAKPNSRPTLVGGRPK